MKKLLALLLALMMVLSLAACADSDKDDDKGGADVSGVDMSKYPADLNDWTAQQVFDYFKERVGFEGCEDWFQDHATYWIDSPIDECAGTWSLDESADPVVFMVFTFNPNNADTTPEQVEEWKEILRSGDHSYITDEYFLGPVSHLVGNVMLDYYYTMDEDVYNALEEAFNDLCSAMGVTPDF